MRSQPPRGGEYGPGRKSPKRCAASETRRSRNPAGFRSCGKRVENHFALRGFVGYPVTARKFSQYHKERKQ